MLIKMGVYDVNNTNDDVGDYGAKEIPPIIIDGKLLCIGLILNASSSISCKG
jgi:hypothetical protein